MYVIIIFLVTISGFAVLSLSANYMSIFKKKENCIFHRQKTLSVTSTDPRNFLALGLRPRARKNLESASVTESSVFLPMKEIAILDNYNG